MRRTVQCKETSAKVSRFFIQLNIKLKAVLINFFVSTMDEIISCNMKSVTCSERPTTNYHASQQFPSALWSVLESLIFYLNFRCSRLYPLYATFPALNKDNQQLAGEHRGAFSSERAEYVPQELVETKRDQKGKWRFDLHLSSGHRHDSKWMQMFSPYQLYKVAICQCCVLQYNYLAMKTKCVFSSLCRLNNWCIPASEKCQLPSHSCSLMMDAFLKPKLSPPYTSVFPISCCVYRLSLGKNNFNSS